MAVAPVRYLVTMVVRSEVAVAGIGYFMTVAFIGNLTAVALVGYCAIASCFYLAEAGVAHGFTYFFRTALKHFIEKRTITVIKYVQDLWVTSTIILSTNSFFACRPDSLRASVRHSLVASVADGLVTGATDCPFASVAFPFVVNPTNSSFARVALPLVASLTDFFLFADGLVASVANRASAGITLSPTPRVDCLYCAMKEWE